MLKRRRSILEFLPHDVVELILERLPVKSLLRFKSVSKKLKSTIESRLFQETQLIRRRQSRGPDVLYVIHENHEQDEDQRRRIVLGSSIVSTFTTSNSMVCHGSCDGLICVFCVHTPNIVVNPATRWQQSFPRSSFQQIMYKRKLIGCPSHKLGFGKDKLKGTYKPVWLCNSSEFGLDNATTCEVFDFSTNAWRYVLPASPFRILDHQKPVYLDGSLYWFSECEETKVLSLDLHTETFQVISKAPFSHLTNSRDVIMSTLDNRLCVSHKNWPTQVIWSFDSSGGGNKTWKKLCSIDLTKTFPVFGNTILSSTPPLPLAILEKNKLLLQGDITQPMVIHDLHTKSYDLVFSTLTVGYPICYFQSLFSVLSN